jgi:lipid-A-disaccharide synthase
VKIAIGIGELSGDLIASGLIKHIQKNYPDIEIIGITGPNCQKIGLKSSFNISELSVRGFFEVIYNYKRLSRFRNNFLNYLYEQKDICVVNVLVFRVYPFASLVLNF